MSWWVCVKCGKRESSFGELPPKLYSNSCPAGFEHAWVIQTKD